MKNLFLLLTFSVFGLFIHEISCCQVLIPKKCYMHLEGLVSKEFPVNVELVKNDDTVFGECVFLGTTRLFERFDNSSEPIPLSGKVSKDGSFVFRLDPWNDPVILTGRFSNAQTLNGTCKTEKRDQNLPFQLSEKYPEGSTPLNACYQKGSVALTRKPGSPTGKIRLSLVVPGESANPLVSDTLKKIILSRYSGNEVNILDPEKIMNGIKQVFFETYVNNNIDIYNKTSGQSFEWESLNYMHVVQNSAHLLAFYTEKYAFTGGAHGLETRSYTLVNMYTGKVVGISDLFHGDYEAKLTELLTSKVKEKFNVGSGQKLTSAGLFVDEVKPSSEFYVTRTGVGFYYNQYDIAPHSYGGTDLFVPFEELKEILVTTGVLRELVH